jgi:hypothetical protein
LQRLNRLILLEPQLIELSQLSLNVANPCPLNIQLASALTR